jgi:hypothetical protein
MRRALTLALSLTGALLLIAISLRSYWVTDTFYWCTTKSDRLVTSTGGGLIYADAQWPNGRVPVPLTHTRTRRPSPTWLESPRHSDGFCVLGFEYSKEVFPQIDPSLSFFIPSYRIVAIPYWAPIALVMLHPLSRLIRRARRLRRTRRGLCAACGYDLRASPSTCPECGATGAARA